jgi:hypothetical protein
MTFLYFLSPQALRKAARSIGRSDADADFRQIVQHRFAEIP